LSSEQDRDTPGRDVLDSISIAAFDLDARIFRTLWHSIVRTPDVALAAVQGDFSRYLSPVRVFVALFGLQFVVAALLGTPLTGTIDQFTSHADDGIVADWLAAGRTAGGNVPTVAEIDTALEAWGSLLLWPIFIIASLPYLVLLKLYRLRLPLWAHLQFYLVPTNASFIVMIAIIPIQIAGMGWFMLALAPALGLYYVCMGWLIVRFYSRSALGTALRLGGLVLLLPVTLILSSIGQLLGTAWILDSQFGLSLIELFRLDSL
jgi:hypothetical protein